MSNQDLYNGTFTQDVTDNVLANTGLDISEIEELLPFQSSNCIELVLQSGRIVIHQLVLLATDLSNKECFETTLNYDFCGENFTYKVKLNITEDPFCDIPIITNITYNNMAFTITGSITSDVWIEYSTDNGATYTRLPNAFPAGASIVTNALPTGVDLKIRLVALCDETKVSNVFDYISIGVCKRYSASFFNPNENETFEIFIYFKNCDNVSVTDSIVNGGQITICAIEGTIVFDEDFVTVSEAIGTCP
jgi:hypothetical protein